MNASAKEISQGNQYAETDIGRLIFEAGKRINHPDQQELQERITSIAIEIGKLFQQIGPYEKISHKHEAAVYLQVLEISHQVLFELIHILHRDIQTLGDKIIKISHEAREHYETFFTFITNKSTSRTSPSPQFQQLEKPFQEWTEEEKSEGKKCFEDIMMILTSARANADSKEEREFFHNLCEEGRLAERKIGRANQKNLQLSTLSQSMQKVLEAQKIIHQRIEALQSIKSE